ncbi:lanthionine synthetase LanC family protein, partial [Actinophytocola sp.]|uniref:lanthionine synthetase LanC family protein n=1 Tax=Actinophytocola sp. TaxID=1872138 RepID=UPI002D7EAFED
ALFLPMTNLVWLHRPKATQFTEIITEHFPVPREFLDKAVEVIIPAEHRSAPSPRIDPEPAGWPEQRDALVRAILASATPDRDDRLFPGDIEQFSVGGLGLAYGAAGVLYALSVSGVDRQPRLEDWLLRRAINPANGTRPGLYDGLHGVAFVLDHLGHRQEALDVIDICLRENWESLGSNLSSGLAGIGLNLLHFADKTGEPVLRLAAHRAAELVAARLRDPDPTAAEEPPLISGGVHPFAGLMQGRSGAALLLMRTYDDTGDVTFLDAAAEALRWDLRRTVVRPNGTLEINEGWRTMPYLAAGSVGIGVAIDAYLARRHDEQFTAVLPGIELVCTLPMYILPGLFQGRSGILHYLAGRSANPAVDPLVTTQVRNLSWHALPYGDGTAFPGSGLMRLSMDLATGTAGVLLALASALHDQPVSLPLLAPVRRPATAEPQTPAPTGVGR